MESILKNAPEILLLLFLIITFLQSGIDKVFDWRGNLSWLKGHFEDTPLTGLVPFLLLPVLVVEMIAAVLCLAGLYQMVVHGTPTIAFYGAIMSCVSRLMLLFGQRMAKDYDGAKTIAVYFIPAIFLVFILQA